MIPGRLSDRGRRTILSPRCSNTTCGRAFQKNVVCKNYRLLLLRQHHIVRFPSHWVVDYLYSTADELNAMALGVGFQPCACWIWRKSDSRRRPVRSFKRDDLHQGRRPVCGALSRKADLTLAE
jgi:hypothetical protein